MSVTDTNLVKFHRLLYWAAESSKNQDAFDLVAGNAMSERIADELHAEASQAAKELIDQCQKYGPELIYALGQVRAVRRSA